MSRVYILYHVINLKNSWGGASNNRIVHAVASLTFQALGVCCSSIRAMLLPLQRMKFFLRTGFGESSTYMGGRDGVTMQCVGQGNTASPATWEVVCAQMVNSHKREGHGAHVKGPISQELDHQLRVLYVDDTDLFTMDNDADDDMVRELGQENVYGWAGKLNAPGGALNLKK